jgi:hypothetical protein
MRPVGVSLFHMGKRAVGKTSSCFVNAPKMDLIITDALVSVLWVLCDSGSLESRPFKTIRTEYTSGIRIIFGSA